MAGYFEYEKEDLDLQVPVLFSLRELRAIELLIGGDTFETGSDWAVVAERAQDKLSEAIIIRRLEVEKNLKSTT
ncbi:hypothetical protein G0D98_19545 [Pseudomonas savastanoi pv. phaseolicola]|uniref:hypothetical protein n=1 Tax=Pseudomonas savastanoi TaxID=29438 RepID=UPI000578B03D|nr:hypothetical protein [Pseudomonas savastanoi]MBN3470660.1 hypothetical protein [Pseudomonas savastanoi pv. phaseolicola]MBN3477686.1 hypothetical protein [Pseudomonas savastanoi pv. phaseolicola]